VYNENIFSNVHPSVTVMFIVVGTDCALNDGLSFLLVSGREFYSHVEMIYDNMADCQ